MSLVQSVLEGLALEMQARVQGGKTDSQLTCVVSQHQTHPNAP